MCEQAVARSAALFDSLGFTVHSRKSVSAPTQTIEFLRFVLDSRNMIVSLTRTNTEKLKQRCTDILQTDMVSVQSSVELIGHLVAALPGVLFGTVFVTQLKLLKIIVLEKEKKKRKEKTNYNPKPIMPLSLDSQTKCRQTSSSGLTT